MYGCAFLLQLAPLRFPALVALVLLAVACAQPAVMSVVDIRTTNDHGGRTIEIETSVPSAGVSVYSRNGDLIAQQRFAGLRRFTITLPAGSGGDLLLRIRDEQDAEIETVVTFAESTDPTLTIRSPFEAGAPAHPLLMIAGSSGTLLVEYASEAIPADARLVLTVSGGARVTQEGAVASGQLEFDITRQVGNHLIVALQPPADADAEVSIRADVLRPDTGEILMTAVRSVHLVSPQEASAALRIASVTMPVDEKGAPLAAARPDLLYIDDERSFATGDGITSVMRPLGWQSVEITNDLLQPVPVIVTASVLDAGGQNVSEAFATPPGIPGQVVRGGATVPAGGRAVLILPVFGEPGRIPPGEYRREATLRVAGSEWVIARRESPLLVERGGGLPLMVTIAGALVTLGAFLYFIFAGAQNLGRYATRQIILIGLFAAVSVVIVTAPAWVVTSVTMVLFGPMGFVVDGLFSVLLFFCLLTVLASLVPRPGICAALVGTRFLLGGLLLGIVTPVGAIHAGVSAVLLESALWLRRRMPHDPMRPGGGVLDLTGLLLLALANTAVSWIGFQLSIVVFRMFYADWYLILSVVLGGFFYSLIGAWMGRNIGRALAPVVA